MCRKQIPLNTNTLIFTNIHIFTIIYIYNTLAAQTQQPLKPSDGLQLGLGHKGKNRSKTKRQWHLLQSICRIWKDVFFVRLPGINQKQWYSAVWLQYKGNIWVGQTGTNMELLLDFVNLFTTPWDGLTKAELITLFLQNIYCIYKKICRMHKKAYK